MIVVLTKIIVFIAFNILIAFIIGLIWNCLDESRKIKKSKYMEPIDDFFYCMRCHNRSSPIPKIEDRLIRIIIKDCESCRMKV